MLDPESILRLYANVMHNDIVVNAIPVSEIRAGVQCMANVYMKNADFLSSVLEFPNYNDAACRCAYLHKYAPLHTFIVVNVMLKILQKELTIFRELVVEANCFKLCSLGGGPGSDVIGVFSALKLVFNSFNASVTIIDCMEEWSTTFKSLLHELKFNGYGKEWYSLAKNFQWNYIGANLLNNMTDEIIKSISSASFLTMVKFVSASTCTNTEEMVDKIFRVMKPGALVLFIDNAAGGFTQIVERASKRNGLEPIFGPLKHEEYEVEALKIERFGYTSCFKTRVTIILLQKVQNHKQTRRNLNSYPSVPDQNNAITSKPVACLDFVVLNDISSKIKMANTINPPRPQGVINQPFAVVKPQKPDANPAVQKPGANPAVQQNRIVVNNKRKADSARSPERPASNGKDLTTNKNNTALGLQRPNASIGQNAWNVPTITPGSRSPGVNSFNAPLLDTSQSFPRNNSGVRPQQNRPNVIAQPPKSLTRSTPTTRLPQSVPSTAVRTYRPAPVDWRERDQSLSDSENNSEEACCTCCTVS